MIGNIPTDSFYKFCAILGTVILIFNSYYNFEKQNEIENDLTYLLGEIKKNSYHTQKVVENSENFNQLLIRINKEKSEDIEYWTLMLEAKNSGKLNKTDLTLLDNEIEESKINRIKIERKIDSINHKIEIKDAEISIAKIDNDTQQLIIENKEKKIKKYKFFLRIGAIIGIILFLFGFINWYKIQKIMDKNLRNGIS